MNKLDPGPWLKFSQMRAGTQVTWDRRPVGGIRPAVVVRTIGAVSPTPIAIDRKIPVRICGRAIGVAIRRMYWVGLAPDPRAASRICRGTELKARSAVRKMYGVMKIARVTAPAIRESPQPK